MLCAFGDQALLGHDDGAGVGLRLGADDGHDPEEGVGQAPTAE